MSGNDAVLIAHGMEELLRGVGWKLLRARLEQWRVEAEEKLHDTTPLLIGDQFAVAEAQVKIRLLDKMLALPGEMYDDAMRQLTEGGATYA